MCFFGAVVKSLNYSNTVLVITPVARRLNVTSFSLCRKEWLLPADALEIDWKQLHQLVKASAFPKRRCHDGSKEYVLICCG